MYSVEQAITIGADAVVILVFPGAPDEQLSLQRLARLVGECEQVGLPVMAESIPGGWGQAVPWTIENVARGVAHLRGSSAPTSSRRCAPALPAEFAPVVDVCPVPVVALGGAKMNSEDDVVALAAGVVQAGAAGIAFGRNVWGSSDPAKLLARLHEAVHGSGSV